MEACFMIISSIIYNLWSMSYLNRFCIFTTERKDFPVLYIGCKFCCKYCSIVKLQLVCFMLLFSSPEHKAIVTGLCPFFVVRQHFYLNIFSSETAHWILTKLHRKDSRVVPYQSCSKHFSWLLKYMYVTESTIGFQYAIFKNILA